MNDYVKTNSKQKSHTVIHVMTLTTRIIEQRFELKQFKKIRRKVRWVSKDYTSYKYENQSDLLAHENLLKSKFFKNVYLEVKLTVL